MMRRKAEWGAVKRREVTTYTPKPLTGAQQNMRRVNGDLGKLMRDAAKRGRKRPS